MEKKCQQEESETLFCEIDDPFLMLHCDRARDTWG